MLKRKTWSSTLVLLGIIGLSFLLAQPAALAKGGGDIGQDGYGAPAKPQPFLDQSMNPALNCESDSDFCQTQAIHSLDEDSSSSDPDEIN